MTTVTPIVQLDLADAGSLVGLALDSLFMDDQREGCCPVCCAPCHALNHLAATGQLDRIAADYIARTGPSDWWDAVAGRVDQVWLARAWRMTDCHDNPEDSGA